MSNSFWFGHSFGIGLHATVCCSKYRTIHPCKCTGLKENILTIRQHCQQSRHSIILQRIASTHERSHHPPYKARCSAHSKAIGYSQVINSNILHTDVVLQPCGHAQHHAAGMSRFSKEAVCSITKYHLQSECHAARTTPYAARQINHKRMLFVHSDSCIYKLIFQSQSRNTISHEQRL